MADTFICAYPNAGLPNEFGAYDQDPDEMAALVRPFAEQGLVNVVGGCCGSTPEHISAIRDMVSVFEPRAVPEHRPVLSLSGLEPFPTDQGYSLRQCRRAHQCHPGRPGSES